MTPMLAALGTFAVSLAFGLAVYGLVYRETFNGPILRTFMSLAGQNGIDPGKWYSLNADGQPVEVQP